MQVNNRLRLASGVASGDGLIVGDTFDLPPPLAWSSAELVSGVCAPCSSGRYRAETTKSYFLWPEVPAELTLAADHKCSDFR